MAYGIVKVDNITFDNGGSDQNVTVSGLYRATTSGVTVYGTIAAGTVSGVTVIGSTTVSGATVTGTTANFTSGNFSNIISSAATMSGALIMANQQQVQFREAVGNGVNHIALQAPAIVSADQTITLPDQTGTVITTGDNGSVSSTMLATNLTISAAAGSAAAPSIAFTGDLNTGIYSPGADQLAVATNGAGRLCVDANGRVGIGASSPTAGYLLDCRGNVKFGSSSTAGVYLGVDSNIPFVQGFDSGATYNQLKFLVGGTEAVRINSSSNVGIGTSSPSEKLHVSGIIIGDSNDNYFGSYSSGSAYLDVGNLATSAAWIDARSTSLTNVPVNIRAKGTGEIIFHQTSGEKVRIDSSGNVGIGTASPSAVLDVVSAAAGVAEFNGPANASIALNSDTVSLKLQCGGEAVFGSTTNHPTTFVTNNTERLRIDSSGRLLVGPAASSIPTLGTDGGLQLHNLANSSGAQLSIVKFNTDTGAGTLILGKSKSVTVVAGAVVANNDTLGTISFVGDDGTDLGSSGAQITCFVDGTPGANDMPGRLTFSTTADGAASPTERLRITSAGNVGIGTSSPTATLDVNGDVKLASINGGPLAGFRNRIINGNFDLWQRGDEFYN